MAAAIGWLNAGTLQGTAVWMAIVFLSVLVHEYGHALTALFFGQRAAVHLVVFGGFTVREGGSLSPWKQFILVLNGPLASVSLALFSGFLYTRMENETLLSEVLFITMIANFFWAALNLLPVQPLDGGKLMTILLERLFGFRGLKASFFIAALFALIISLYAFYRGSLFIGSIFFLFMYESARSFWAVRDLTASDHDTVFQKQLERAKENLDKGHVAEAKAELESLIEQSGRGILHTTAKEVLGRIIASEGDLQTAFDLLSPIQDALSAESLAILHEVTMQLSNWSVAASLGKKLYRLRPSAKLALQNATAEAHLKHIEPMMGWLMRARQEGALHLDTILNEAPFKEYHEHIVETMRRSL